MQKSLLMIRLVSQAHDSLTDAPASADSPRPDSGARLGVRRQTALWIVEGVRAGAGPVGRGATPVAQREDAGLERDLRPRYCIRGEGPRLLRLAGDLGRPPTMRASKATTTTAA